MAPKKTTPAVAARVAPRYVPFTWSESALDKALSMDVPEISATFRDAYVDACRRGRVGRRAFVSATFDTLAWLVSIESGLKAENDRYDAIYATVAATNAAAA